MPDIYENSSFLMGSMSDALSNSMITDPVNYIMDMNSGQTSNIFKNDPDRILEYLKDYDYVKGLIDAFASPLREILTKNEYKISFKPDHLHRYEDFINNKLKVLNLQDILLDSLPVTIYRGGFFRLNLYNKDTKEFHLTNTVDPWKTVYVERLGKPIGFIRRNSHFIDVRQGVFAAYSLYPKKTVPLSSIKNPKIRKDILGYLGGDIDKSDEPDILVYVHSVPRSIFYGQAQKLFQIFLNDFILQVLALKDSIRQDIFTVTVQAVAKKTVNTAKVTQAIEEVLNQGSNLLVQQDPQTMISQVAWAMFNSARVLPCVENYSAINSLDMMDLKNKRAQLQAETEDLKRQVLSNLGIPEELQTGTGNRWEILSRSDKYLTAINAFVMLYENVVRNLVVSMMYSLGRYCDPEDISFSLLNDTPLQSQMARNKTALLTDSLRDELLAINEVKMLIGTGYVDAEKVVTEFTSQIQRYNLPFSTGYRDVKDIVTDMNDPSSPVTQYTDMG